MKQNSKKNCSFASPTARNGDLKNSGPIINNVSRLLALSNSSKGLNLIRNKLVISFFGRSFTGGVRDQTRVVVIQISIWFYIKPPISRYCRENTVVKSKGNSLSVSYFLMNSVYCKASPAIIIKEVVYVFYV